MTRRFLVTRPRMVTWRLSRHLLLLLLQVTTVLELCMGVLYYADRHPQGGGLGAVMDGLLQCSCRAGE